MLFESSWRYVSVIIATVALFGCGGSDSGNRQDKGDSMQVGLLTPGPISDQSWNAGAYEGLQWIRDSLGARISHIQTRTPAEFDENFRQYGSQGYDLVIGHGFEFQDAANRIAPQFPKTVYVVTSGRVTAPNVAGMAFAFEEASYQAGIVAGLMTRSNIVGLIGGTELPPVRASFEAFERGAHSVNPKVRVVTAYIGNWEDASAGKEQALAQIARGADIIFQNADAAGLGVFQAARERNILAFGTNSNQNDVAPDVVIGSVVIELPRALLSVAREVHENRFEGRVIEFGVREDVVHFVPNPAMMDRIPARAIQLVDSLGVVMRAGEFRLIDDIISIVDTAQAVR